MWQEKETTYSEPSTSAPNNKIITNRSSRSRFSAFGEIKWWFCILLLTDHFIRYTQAYPTKNKTAKTAANHLYNGFILRFGIPSKILHNQGEEFDNDLFKNLANLLGIQNLRTTPYHPQTNGLTERMNQTVLSMLRTLPEKYKSSWKNYLSKVIYAYNCTRHSNTGCSP